MWELSGLWKSCNKCGKKNRFANVCFEHLPKPRYRARPVHCFKSELSDEVFGVEEISAVTLDDSQLVTLKLEFGNYLRFQPDTGAQCNVVPVQEGDQRFWFAQCDPVMFQCHRSPGPFCKKEGVTSAKCKLLDMTLGFKPFNAVLQKYAKTLSPA